MVNGNYLARIMKLGAENQIIQDMNNLRRTHNFQDSNNLHQTHNFQDSNDLRRTHNFQDSNNLCRKAIEEIGKLLKKLESR